MFITFVGMGKEIDDRPLVDTDVELWREPQENGNVDYYSDSIHRTITGSIGIDVGGYVIVKTLKEWHELAYKDFVSEPKPPKQ